MLNGSYFTSEKDKIPMLDGYNSTEIQPQQPSFINTEMLAKIQSSSEGLTISLIVIQVVCQVFMKSNMEIMFKLFLNMQIQQSLPIYQVNIPYKS